MIPDPNTASGLGMPSAGGLNTSVQPPVSLGVPMGGAGPAPIVPSQPSVEAAASTAASEDLEQDWVEKARDIVERTKSDPFTESIELNKVKAGFLKARYDKQINIAEDKP